MNLCSIASGSSGNCIYVGTDSTHILVDAGISGKRITAGLESIQVPPSELSAILITHEHSDHIQGLGVMARKYHIPIYATVETFHAIFHQKNVGKIAEELVHPIEPDYEFRVGDMEIHPFAIYHDAANPVCYTMTGDGHKVAVATDIGHFDDYTIQSLDGSEALLLEANHDINMLEVGPYPYVLKQRILGDRGHLSNDNTGRLLCRLYHDNLQYILLGHLSKENNYPELAYETVRYELGKGLGRICDSCRIIVAERDVPSGLITL